MYKCKEIHILLLSFTKSKVFLLLAQCLFLTSPNRTKGGLVLFWFFTIFCMVDFFFKLHAENLFSDYTQCNVTERPVPSCPSLASFIHFISSFVSLSNENFWVLSMLVVLASPLIMPERNCTGKACLNMAPDLRPSIILPHEQCHSSFLSNLPSNTSLLIMAASVRPKPPRSHLTSVASWL